MPMASTTAGMSEGTVTKLDPAKGRITINTARSRTRHARHDDGFQGGFVGYARQRSSPVTPGTLSQKTSAEQ